MKKYELLNTGEAIRAGDEGYYGGRWKTIGPDWACVGTRLVTRDVGSYRRLVGDAPDNPVAYEHPIMTVSRIRVLLHAISLSISVDRGDWVMRAYQDLMMGRAWLGKIKGAYGIQTPYPVAESVNDIIPLDDSGPALFDLIPGVDHFNDRILHCTLLIDRIKHCVDQVNTIGFAIDVDLERGACIRLLNEASFSLGFEIYEIGRLQKEVFQP